MDVADLLETLTNEVLRLQARVDELERQEYGAWRGTKSTDFTTTDLPNPGDYGYQTTALEVQMNIGGTVRAITTAAL